MTLKNLLNKTNLYYYDKDTLTFKVGKWLYVLYISIIFNLIIIGKLLTNNLDINFKYISTIKILQTKNQIIQHLEVKDQDTAIEWKDFRKSLPLTMSKQEENKLHSLYFKYKDLINSHHCPHNLLWYIAFKESRLNLNAKNSSSSAQGMFQFINGTWNAMCKRGGMDISGRFNEAKQVKVMCIYLDFLFEKYKNWQLVHKEYTGGVIHYRLPYYK
jgi:hypothetical protein